jgi:hypothetical protein
MVGPLIETRLHAMQRTQADLVRALQRLGAHVTKQSVSSWMSGKTRPSDGHMHLLFDALVIPVEEQPGWWAARAGRDVVTPVALEDQTTECDTPPEAA